MIQTIARQSFRVFRPSAAQRRTSAWPTAPPQLCTSVLICGSVCSWAGYNSKQTLPLRSGIIGSIERPQSGARLLHHVHDMESCVATAFISIFRLGNAPEISIGYGALG